MFRTRLISGIILVAIVLGLFVAGGDILLVAMCIVSLIGMSELYRIFSIDKEIIGIVSYFCTVLFYLNLHFDLIKDKMLFAVLLLIFDLICMVLQYPKYKADQLMAAFFGFFYVALMLSYIYQTRVLPKGMYLVWLIILCSWGSDTCAYCVGVLFGKHKMAPVLSPKKSIEGAVGGVVGAMLLTFIYGMIFHDGLRIPMQAVWILALISGAGALISMVGDLAASAIKRIYDVKDYGTLIPGHGGILDRFDSVIITAPIIYYLCSYLMV